MDALVVLLVSSAGDNHLAEARGAAGRQAGHRGELGVGDEARGSGLDSWTSSARQRCGRQRSISSTQESAQGGLFGLVQRASHLVGPN